MQAPRSFLVYFLSGGLIVFLFAISLGYFYHKKTDSLAFVKIIKGEVLHTKKANTEAQVQSKQFLVNDLDTLFVSEKGSALFITQSGYEIILSKAALVSLEMVGSKLVLSHHSGHLGLKKVGDKDSLYIENDSLGQLEAYRYFERKIELGQLEQVLPARPDFRENLGEEKSLSDTYIAAKLSSQKKYFKKCFTNLLQKKPEAQGLTQIFFRLEGNGKVSHVGVPQNPYADRQFDQCVTEVVKRLRFKAFRGHSLELAFKLSPTL